jgi:hypothetical protein
MTSQIYYRRWQVWLGEQMVGEVLARTAQAACLRAIQRFKIGRDQHAELRVRRLVGDAYTTR